MVSALLRGDRIHRPRWYTVAEAAEMLGETQAAVAKKCQRGVYPVRVRKPGRGRPYEVLGSFVRSEALKRGGR